MSYTNKLLSVLLMAVFTATVASANFYVIPVKVKMKNLIRVAKSGGDFNDPVKAMASIQGANYSNHYALYLENDFNLTSPLHIKDYVDIYGNGHTLYGNISSSDINSSALIYGGNYTLIYDMHIHNYGLGVDKTTGISFSGVNAQLSNVWVHISDEGTKNYGILNQNSSEITVNRSYIVASGKITNAVGIENIKSKLELDNSSINMTTNETIYTTNITMISLKDSAFATLSFTSLESNGAQQATGISMNRSFASLVHSSINSHGSVVAIGAFVEDYSVLNIDSSNIFGSNATSSSAIISSSSVYITTYGSLINGDSASITSTYGSKSVFVKSSLMGSISIDNPTGSTAVCIDSTLSGNDLNISCQ